MRSIVKTGAVAIALSFAGVASAATIIPVSATGSSSFNGYPDSDAIDQDAGSNISDWASASQGVGSFLNVDLGALYNLTSANGTDRVTSGGPNNAFFGGLFDYTTAYTFQAYTDATFSTTLGAAYSYTKAAPGSTATPGDFAFSAALPGLQARYVRYTVDATNGVNPGLSNLSFEGTAVPEPATWAMMILGFGLVGGAMRSRRRQTLATA